MDGCTRFVRDAENCAEIKAVGPQFADDAVTIVPCGPLTCERLAIWIVVRVIHRGNNEVVAMHGHKVYHKKPPC